jgi:hypothetical protein
MNPNLQALAAAGDPRAIAILQQMQGGPPGMPPGGPPPGAGGPPGGAMPPGMMPPPGMPPGGPPQGMPPQAMGQPPPISPDMQARKAMMLQQILRQRGGQ